MNNIQDSVENENLWLFPEAIRWTYKWFMPTDESSIALGEFEVSVTPDKIEWRLATWLEIDNLSISLSEMLIMSPEEIAKMYKEWSIYNKVALEWKKFLWYKLENGLKFIFTLSPNKKEYWLIVRWSMADYLGPTLLYSPVQVRQWIFKKSVRNIMLLWWDFPRLKHDWKNPPARSYFKRIINLEI